jgi:hypothetical protein
MLSLSTTRLQNAIIDYYRAFEQRSSWARENLLISNEVEEYENRLVDEWVRYREVIFENIGDASPDDACMHAGGRAESYIVGLNLRRPHSAFASGSQNLMLYEEPFISWRTRDPIREFIGIPTSSSGLENFWGLLHESVGSTTD